MATSTLRDKAKQRGCRAFVPRHANPHAPPELLSDACEDERTSREGDDGGDRCHPCEHGPGSGVVNFRRLDDGRITELRPEQELQHRDDHTGSHRERQRTRELRAGGFAPRHQGAEAGEEQQDDAQRDHPLVVEPRTYRDLLTADPLAEKRKRRRDEHEHHHAEQHPVVQEKSKLPAHEGFNPVVCF